MKIRASAPSNIALVKYMGKSDSSRNLPANPSLSMTLSDFRSTATVETSSSPSWEWVGDALSPKERDRALNHAATVEAKARKKFQELGIPLASASGFLLSCTSDFPARAGVASSASSFAAMTLAVLGALDAEEVFRSRYDREFPLRAWAASLSREGSGSSCRSFGGPFVHWEGEKIREIQGNLPPLVDLLLVIEDSAKEVSSSDAHRRCTASPLFEGRAERASLRSAEVERAIEAGDLVRIAEAAWADAWEMHSLFHTSLPPFTYFKPRTLEALQWFSRFLGDPIPPIVTLDAGPNLHVLIPEAQEREWEKRTSYPSSTSLRERE